MNEGILSPADVAVLSGNNRNDGFGDNGAWWIILFLIFGWGGNGFGRFGGNGGGQVGDNYVLASDFSQLSKQISDTCNMTDRKFDAINNGLCSIGYQELQNINSVNTNITTVGNAIQGQIADVGYGIKDCCCQTLRAIDQVNFNNAQNTCAITNTMNMNTRDIIDNQNANYRALHDEIIANRIEDKNAQIAAQQNEINALRLSASQCAQNQYLIGQLKPCPTPAYVVPNPYCNCNNGCGCNNF